MQLLIKQCTTRSALVAVAYAVLVLPALALAANPVKGRSYNGDGGTSIVTVSKNGKTAKVSAYPGKCDNGFGLTATKPATISKGKLSYSGPAKVATFKGTLTVTGTFVTPEKLKWTVKVKSGSCTSKHTSTLNLVPKS